MIMTGNEVQHLSVWQKSLMMWTCISIVPKSKKEGDSCPLQEELQTQRCIGHAARYHKLQVTGKFPAVSKPMFPI